MSRIIHKIGNSGLNVKHNIQWYFEHNVSRPWADLSVNLLGRESQLDSWHKSQKEQFKELFIKSFKEEQEQLLPQRKAQRRLELENQGKSEKEILKELKKLKVRVISRRKKSSNHHSLSSSCEIIPGRRSIEIHARQESRGNIFQV